MANITYHVIACIDGRHDVMGDTADPNETVGQVAERAHRGESYRTTQRTADASSLGSDQAEPQDKPTPICGVHGTPMKLVHGSRGDFWSCHRRDENGSWCDYRPPRIN